MKRVFHFNVIYKITAFLSKLSARMRLSYPTKHNIKCHLLFSLNIVACAYAFASRVVCSSELAVVEVVIEVFCLQQGIMGSTLNDFSIFYDEHLVCFPDCAESMCDDKACSILHQPEQSFLDSYFRAGIDVASCLIQNQYLWVSNNSSGNSEKLPLSLTEIVTSLAKHRAVFIRQSSYPLVCVC